MARYFRPTTVSCLLLLVCLGAQGRSIDEIIRQAAEESHITYGNNVNATELVEMDIMLTKEQWEEIQEMKNENESGRTRRKAITSTRNRWTNNIVPYRLANIFSNSEKQQIQMGVDEWNKYTCLTLKPYTNERNYVDVADHGSGCTSYVGMIGGAQKLSLGRGCRVRTIVVHELGHAIGFHHEQTRPDRDAYVTINVENIVSGYEFAFQKYSPSYVQGYGVDYDYGSIMHYSGKGFSKNGKDTITTKDPYWQNRIGNAPGLSFPDIKLANIIYKCGEHCGAKTCPSGGYLDKNCKCMCKGSPVKECSGGDGGDEGGDEGGDDNKDCRDLSRHCDNWTSVGYCNHLEYKDYMTQNCPKACGLC